MLLPHLGSVVINSVADQGAGLLLDVRLRADRAVCPRCGVASVRVHSRYQRRFGDVPVAGRPVQLRLQVRRFFCGNAACPARTFAEQPAELTALDGVILYVGTGRTEVVVPTTPSHSRLTS